MNRDIKFRGKRVDNSEWVFGCYISGGNTNGSDPNEYAYILPPDCDFDEAIEVDPATVGQYTGQKDGDGKDIYEGDRWFYGRLIVSEIVWNEETCAFACMTDDGDVSDHLYGAEFGSVIGNIYDDK